MHRIRKTCSKQGDSCFEEGKRTVVQIDILGFVEEREMRIIDLTEDKVDYIEDKLYEYDEAYISYKLNCRI